jgi:hypothetical protein
MQRDEQVERNLSYAFDLLDKLVHAPELLDEIPDGAHVVVLPDDDPDLRAANKELIEGSARIALPGIAVSAEGTVTPPMGRSNKTYITISVPPSGDEFNAHSSTPRSASTGQ